jgi:hypothetical protein
VQVLPAAVSAFLSPYPYFCSVFSGVFLARASFRVSKAIFFFKFSADLEVVRVA